jgi:hypothetical protein
LFHWAICLFLTATVQWILCIFYILTHITIRLQICSHSLACLFILSIVSLAMQELFSLMYSHSFIFARLAMLLVSHTKSHC